MDALTPTAELGRPSPGPQGSDSPPRVEAVLRRFLEPWAPVLGRTWAQGPRGLSLAFWCVHEAEVVKKAPKQWPSRGLVKSGPILTTGLLKALVAQSSAYGWLQFCSFAAFSRGLGHRCGLLLEESGRSSHRFAEMTCSSDAVRIPSRFHACAFAL